MAKVPQKNEILTLRIEGYGSDGAGVSHMADGRVLFVKGALAGELCRVQLLKLGKSAGWGRVVEVVEPAAARVGQDCPYYPVCGGCQLRHMDYAEELRFKQDRVQEALRRIGAVEIPVSAMHAADETARYRNKVQFPVADGVDGALHIGFYRSRSHQVIDVADCLLQPIEAARLRTAVKDFMQRHGISAYEERRHEGLVRHVYVRVNQAGESLCVLVVNGKSLPQEAALVDALRGAEPKLRGVLLSRNEEKTNVIMGKRLRLLWGEQTLMDRLCGLDFRLSPHSFYQVNRAQAERLYRRALDFADLHGTETVLDLYCGIGTITLAMARRAGRVIGAEVVEAAVRDAWENALQNGIQNVSFLCADAGEAAALLAERGERPQVICVDPPRKGLSLAVIDAIVSMRPDRLVYVSCDPATFARDVKLLGERGYTIRQAECFDLFPRTQHVETVGLFTPLTADI